MRLVVTRNSHATKDFSEADLRGEGAQAFAAYYPFKKTEKWYIMLANATWNAVIAYTHTSLKEAELCGLQYCDPIDKKNQVRQYPHVMCLCWVTFLKLEYEGGA